MRGLGYFRFALLAAALASMRRFRASALRRLMFLRCFFSIFRRFMWLRGMSSSFLCELSVKQHDV